jgi:hypothetical protein
MVNLIRVMAITFSVSVACHQGLAQCAWEHVPTPPSGGVGETPYDVDGTGPDDVWLVGELITGQYPSWDFWNFAMHFDGQAWSVVPTPNPDDRGDHNELMGVVAVTPSEAYAAGSTKYLGAQQAQILSWDGNEWSVEVLNLIDDFGFFNRMGRAGDEVWAIGERGNPQGPPYATGISLSARRVNGQWVEEYVPPLARFGGRSTNALYGLDGVTEDDAWAVGSAYQTHYEDNFGPKRYALHWDGTEWTIDDTLPDLEPSFLNDVDMIAHDDVWAAGYYVHRDESGDNTNQPWILHYDGAAWTMAELPFYPHGALLRGVAARSADDVYAFGVAPDEDNQNRPLILHYDGTSWTQMPPATTDGTKEQFMAAAALPDGSVWGIGLYVSPSGPLTERLVCEGCARDPQWVCDGDVDGNGAVNPVDVGLVQAAFGSADPQDLCNYDLDCNEAINPVDAGIVQSRFGECEEPRSACP